MNQTKALAPVAPARPASRKEAPLKGGSMRPSARNSIELYPMVNMILPLAKPYWKVSNLVVLQSRTQILRAVVSPLTRLILKNVEETLRYRKQYEEQLCRLSNYGLSFVNHIIFERLKNACWYVYALQLKCKKEKKSDSYVPHRLFIELGLHRKPATSWFARKVLRKQRKSSLPLMPTRKDTLPVAQKDSLLFFDTTELKIEEAPPLSIVPFHSNYRSDETLKDYVETPLPDEHAKIEYATVVLEVLVGERNGYDEPAEIDEDPTHVILTEEDETYLAGVKKVLEGRQESLGRISVRYIRPAVLI